MACIQEEGEEALIEAGLDITGDGLMRRHSALQDHVPISGITLADNAFGKEILWLFGLEKHLRTHGGQHSVGLDQRRALEAEDMVAGEDGDGGIQPRKEPFDAVINDLARYKLC
jgi:hypothetical protein